MGMGHVLVHSKYSYFINRDAGEKQRGSLDRILNIWEDRGVYTKDFMKNLRQKIFSGDMAAQIKDALKEDILAPRKESNPKKESTPRKEEKPRKEVIQKEITPKEVVSRKRRRKDEPEQPALKVELDSMKHDELGSYDVSRLVK